MPVETRQNERFVAVVPVTIEGDLLRAHTHTANLSKEGCVISISQPLAQGQYVSLMLALPKLMGAVRIQLAAVRWKILDLCGLEFIRLTEQDRTRLHRYLQLVKLLPNSLCVARIGSHSLSPTRREKVLEDSPM
jgi:hypothetical protein